MPPRCEQLQEFNGAGEDDQINREQAALLVEAQAEGKSGCRKNCQMLEVMGSYGLWSKPGRYE